MEWGMWGRDDVRARGGNERREKKGDPKGWFTPPCLKSWKLPWLQNWYDWRGRQHRRLPRAANSLAPPLRVKMQNDEFLHQEGREFVSFDGLFVCLRRKIIDSTQDQLEKVAIIDALPRKVPRCDIIANSKFLGLWGTNDLMLMVLFTFAMRRHLISLAS